MAQHAQPHATDAFPTASPDPFRVVRLEAGDEAGLRDWYAVHAAAQVHDHAGFPDDPWEEFRQRQLEQRSDSANEVWLLRDGTGELAGGVQLHLPLADNTDVVELDLVVAPARRREGAGSMLLRLVRDRARELGRTRLVSEIGAPIGADSAGERFAAAHGATRALEEVRRMLDLTALDEAELAELDREAAGHADGYELLQFAGLPDDALLPELAALVGRMSTDAPMGDLDWEAEAWDAGRVRERYMTSEAAGRLLLTTAVRHVASGRLVGYTDIAVSRYAPETGYQWDTIVLGEHRGHRLGTLLKIANLRQLRAHSPGTRYLHTWNAAVNAHMVAINEQLGFRPVERSGEWVLALDECQLADQDGLLAQPE